jgi:hypothetical protein
MHLEFLDEEVWYKFNQTVAKVRGWSLPTMSNTTKKEKKVSQICQEPKPTVIGIGQLRNRVFHSSVFVCEDGGQVVAFLGFCPG